MYGHAWLLLEPPCACGRPVTIVEAGVRLCARCALSQAQAEDQLGS